MNKFTFKQAWIVHTSFIKEDKTLKKKILEINLFKFVKTSLGFLKEKRQFANHRKLE